MVVMKGSDIRSDKSGVLLGGGSTVDLNDHPVFGVGRDDNDRSSVATKSWIFNVRQGRGVATLGVGPACAGGPEVRCGAFASPPHSRDEGKRHTGLQRMADSLNYEALAGADRGAWQGQPATWEPRGPDSGEQLETAEMAEMAEMADYLLGWAGGDKCQERPPLPDTSRLLPKAAAVGRPVLHRPIQPLAPRFAKAQSSRSAWT
jgi:hypothetical protein